MLDREGSARKRQLLSVNQPSTMFERHFSVGTLAELWGYSEDTVTRMFAAVPGLMKVGTEPGKGRRPRMTVRIPESIAWKVYSEKIR